MFKIVFKNNENIKKFRHHPSVLLYKIQNTKQTNKISSSFKMENCSNEIPSLKKEEFSRIL